MKKFLAAFLATLISAGLAHAQSSSQLSEREQAYVSRLDLALPGAARNSASVGAQPWHRLTRGLRAQVGDTEVQRFRFVDAEAAQVFASQRTPGYMDNQPGFVEVRGNQVVVVYGPQAGQATATRQLRRAAWEGLPHAPGAPSMVIGTLPDQTRFVQVSDQVSQSERPEIQEMLAEVRQRRASRRGRDRSNEVARWFAEGSRALSRAQGAQSQPPNGEPQQSQSAQKPLGAKPNKPLTRPGKPGARPEGAGKRAGPMKPTQTIKPTKPTRPVKPTWPRKPTKPRVPSKPTKPRVPSKPTKPRVPRKPVKPRVPRKPVKPRVPRKPVKPRVPSKPVKPRVPSKPVKPRVPSKPVKPVQRKGLTDALRDPS